MKISDLNDIGIIIAPSDLHGAILKYKNKYPYLNFKLLSKEQVLEEYFGRAASGAIGYLIKYYGLSFENAITIHKYINRGNINSLHEKITYLGKIKQELISENLFEISEYFSYELAQKRVLIVGYDEDLELINILKTLVKELRIVPFVKGTFLPNVVSFKSINEEVFHVFNEICEDISKGINVEDILVVAKGEEYQMAINKMCDFFNLPHAVDIKTPLFASEVMQKELEKINSSTFQEYLENNPNPQLVKLIKKYGLESLCKNTLIKALHELLKREYSIMRGSLNLKVTPNLPFVNQYKKVFLLGFNQGNYPVVKKDDEYLSDYLKQELSAQTSKDESKVNKMRIIDFITNQENLVITYKMNAMNTSFYPSSLIQELGLKVIEANFQEAVYSRKYLELLLASQMDLKRIYGETTKALLAYQKIAQIPYKMYDYHFKGIKALSINQKRNYSYSRIKTFFECQFAYYCKHILKLDSFESSFATNFGSLAHNILEHVYDEDFNFDNLLNQIINNYEFSESEKVFLNRRIEDVLYVSQILREHYQQMKVKEIYSENKYAIDLTENLSVFGIIDRIFITTDGANEYFSIIDYKTGDESIDLDLVRFGYSMQLPIYALLLSKEYELEKFLGFYIQPLTLNKISIPSENRLDFYKKHLKLRGFSSDNLNALATFDPTYVNSKYIQSMRLKNDGTFYAYTKVLSTEQIKNVVNLAKEQLISADAKIIDNQFEINPKIIKKDRACKFCPFSDVCFKEEDAFIYLNVNEGGKDDVD